MNCQFCEKICKNLNSLRNHERRCPKNPDRVYKSYTVGLTAWNKGESKKSDPRIAQYAQTLKEQYADGTLTSKGCINWSTSERSLAAKKQGFGGYRENAGRSKKYRVKDSFGKETVLQSSYELRCSKILDSLGIAWVRPRHIKYDGDRRYFPDFFLPDLGLYLDPKNDYKAKQDQEKINKVRKQNNITVLILREKHLSEDYISTIVQRQNRGPIIR